MNKRIKLVGFLLAGLLAAAMPASAKQFKVVHYFGHHPGSAEYPGAFTLDSHGNLYGLAEGGPAGRGLIYKYDTSGNYAVVYRFTPQDGFGANNLVVKGHALYGTSFYGIKGSAGLVFSVRTDGTGLRVLHTFVNDNAGALPLSLIVGASGVIYGTGFARPSSGEGGVLFSLHPDGTGYTVLARPSYATGLHRDGDNGLILSYGEDDSSGFHNAVLRHNIASGTLATLYTFPGLQGYFSLGAVDGQGNVFGTTTDTKTLLELQRSSGYQPIVLYDFRKNEFPAGVTLLRDGTLLGVAYDVEAGGNIGQQSLFGFAGGRLTTLHRITRSEQGVDISAPLQRPDGSLIGTGGEGGPANLGILYRFDPKAGPS